MFENAPIGIFRSTPQGKFLKANPALGRILGYDSSDSLITSVDDIGSHVYFDPHERSRVMNSILSIDGWRELETLFKKKDGEKIIVKLFIRAVRDSGDVLIEGFVEDITNKKNTEIELAQERTHFKTLVDEALFAIALIEAGKGFQYVNPAFVQMFGYEMNDLPNAEGWFCRAFPDKQDYRIAVNRWKHFTDNCEKGLSQSHTMSITCKDGSRKEISVKLVAIRRGVYCVTCVDISEQVRTAAVLRQNQARLQALLRLAQMGDASPRDLAEFSIEEAVHLTGSKYGRLSLLIPEDQPVIERYASRSMDKNAVAELNLERIELDNGNSAFESLKHRRPLVINDHDRNEVVHGFNNLGEPINNYLSLPVLDGKKIVAVVEVANKATDFNEEDIHQLTLLMAGFWRIIQRRRAEDALAASEERYRSMINESPFGIIICQQPERNIVYSNHVAQTLFGYGENEIQDLTIWDIIHPKDHALLDKPSDASDSRAELHLSPVFSGVKKDGSAARFEITTADVVYCGKGAIQCSFRDVTEREQLERQLQHSQKMEAVGTLANGVAHEFNNILMSIKGYTQLVNLATDCNDKVLNYIGKIDDCAERAAELTSKMLTFSRLESGDKTPINVNEAIDTVVSLLTQTIAPNIEISLSLTPNPPLIMGNRNHIEQVLLNLAVNARDAMAGGGRITIKTSLRQLEKTFQLKHPWAKPGRYLELSVQDTGHGMSKDVLEHLFEPFFTTKEPGKGTGLGLAVAYSIIKNHGGYITAENAPAGCNGAMFNVFLPAQRDYQLLPSCKKAEDEKIGGSGERILVVDDEETVREIYQTALSSFNYHTVSASNGGEALRLFKEARNKNEPFDLVILDYAMPVMDGEQCFELLVDIDPDVKVLIATGHVEAVNGLSKLKNRISGLLKKPFHLKDLLSEVHTIINSACP